MLVVTLNTGCVYSAAAIPNTVGDDEYSVYAAWIAYHFKEQPESLLLADRTFIFDPIGGAQSCGKTLETQGHVDVSLLLALHDLGEAMYPVQTGKFQLPQFRILWKYQESIGLSEKPLPPFRLVAFSRVAFNRNRTEALFAVSNLVVAYAVAEGLCWPPGKGEAGHSSQTWVAVGFLDQPC